MGQKPKARKIKSKDRSEKRSERGGKDAIRAVQIRNRSDASR